MTCDPAIADRGHGRLTVQANADRAYTGILTLLTPSTANSSPDEVSVFRRGEAAPCRVPKVGLFL
jgi:hypothetical protein